MVILRRLLGEVLRDHRVAQGRTLRQVSAVARVSLGYLSEVERGHKEASSELLAAICSALDIPLSRLLLDVSDAVAGEEAAARAEGTPATVTLRPVPRPTASSSSGVVAAA